MKTLTITEARKNLGRLLAAAQKGEDIGIISGNSVIALRKVEVEATDYALREYGASPDEIAAIAAETRNRYRRLKRSGKLVTTTAGELRKMLE